MRRIKSIALAGCVWALCAFAGDRASVAPPVVPESLKAPEGQSVMLKANAEGVQIYACQAKAGEPGSFAWTFKAPEAVLKDETGETIGKHYAGPTWEAKDGSKVVGQMQQQADAPAEGAIPWLLLRAKSNEGAGIFQKVAYIQRVNTAGGKAPAAGCDSQHVGGETRVAYKATYYFYGADQGRASTDASSRVGD